MGFNYGMQGKTSQQQAIVRQREREEELRKKERVKQNKIICKPLDRTGDFEAVTFEQGVRTLLELQISRTAIANEPCGLDEEKIHVWIEEVGFKYVEKNQQFEKVLITTVDVENGKLKTDWDKLTRVEQK